MSDTRSDAVKKHDAMWGILSMLGVVAVAAWVFVSLATFEPRSARAQITTPGLPMLQLGYCQLATLSSSIGLASCAGGIPAGANAVTLRVTTQAARYRTDGATTAPTASVGMPMLAADSAIFYQGDLASLRFIESTSGSILNVTFYKAVQ